MQVTAAIDAKRMHLAMSIMQYVHHVIWAIACVQCRSSRGDAGAQRPLRLALRMRIW